MNQSTNTGGALAANGRRLTVEQLAQAKRLPLDFLVGLGVKDAARGVVIPYFGATGEDLFVRERLALEKSPGRDNRFRQPTGVAAAAYGQNRLDAAARAGSLILVEGESDCWVLWFHGFPALGLPGSSSARSLVREHVEAIQTIYIHKEPDNGGETFAKGVKARLVELGFKGKVYELTMPAGVKDPADLHVLNPDEFKAAMRARIQAALPITTAAPSGNHLTDLGNAERLVKRHGHELRHCFLWREWLSWDGKRWPVDDTGEISRRAVETVRSILGEAQACEDDKQRAIIGSHAFKSEGAKPIRAMIDLARSIRPIPILPSEMDVAPWLLNVENGTIDLRTGLLRDHRRKDLLTKLAPVAFDAAAKCPRWMAFLRWAMAGDEALVGYLQRIVGYALTAYVSEHILWFFHGGGGNGKSTFLGVVLKMLGDYGTQAVTDLVMVKKHDAHPTERADLFGKRFVATIETEQGKAIAEALMKQLTGGDPIKARKLYKDFFQFDPTHKIVLAANHKPVIHGTDHANWRRIKLVPWTVTIGETEKDKDLPSKLLKELPGILTWAVRGCLEWQRDGLKEPAIVTAATTAYRAEQDVFRGFVDSCCETGPHARVKSSALFEAYQQWTGDKTMTNKAFGQRLKEMNYEAKRENTGVFYRGIELLEPERV